MVQVAPHAWQSLEQKLATSYQAHCRRQETSPARNSVLATIVPGFEHLDVPTNPAQRACSQVAAHHSNAVRAHWSSTQFAQIVCTNGSNLCPVWASVYLCPQSRVVSQSRQHKFETPFDAQVLRRSPGQLGRRAFLADCFARNRA